MIEQKQQQPAFQKTQYQLAGFLRNPDHEKAPEGIEPRRLKIYQDLIYNNIESFISSGFPILRSLYDDDVWHTLVRSFIVKHQCHTPYFLEISQEFLHFLQEQFTTPPAEKPFLLELAHYEWVELALSVSSETTPSQPQSVDNLLECKITVSPLAWRLCYQFPVHKLGEDFQPLSPPESPTFLVVYRDWQEQVQFMEVNAVTSRLLQLIEESGSKTAAGVMAEIAQELGQPLQSIEEFGAALLSRLYAAGILLLVG